MANNYRTIRCPSDGCEVEIDSEDLHSQIEHIEAQHPEIVAERLGELHRWDGWEDR